MTKQVVESRYELTYDLEGDIASAIEYLQARQREGFTRLSWEPRDYEEGNALCIYKYRDETPEEIAEREAQEVARVQQVIDSERKYLDALAKKYGYNLT